MPDPAARPKIRLENSETQEAIRLRLTQDAQGNFVRDWIYGGIDGTITTFAIVAGVAGADLPGTVVLVLGLANLIADGFAMSAGNDSATKADLDQYNRVLAIERKHIALKPLGEREEIRRIFALKGFAGEKLERIVAVISSNEDRWAKTMAVEEYGVAFTARPPLLAALNTAAAFLICGLVPLGSYLIAYGQDACVAATGLVFFAIGAIKSRWSLAGWLRTFVQSPLSGDQCAATAPRTPSIRAPENSSSEAGAGRPRK